MSTDVQTAVVQHALDVAHLHVQNAALNRGIPNQPPRITIGPQSAATVAPATASAAAAAPAAASGGNWLRTAAIVGASLLTGGAGAGGVALLANALNRPAATNTTTVVPVEQNASLLQYLEDHGYHLPREKRSP